MLKHDWTILLFYQSCSIMLTVLLQGCWAKGEEEEITLLLSFSRLSPLRLFPWYPPTFLLWLSLRWPLLRQVSPAAKWKFITPNTRQNPTICYRAAAWSEQCLNNIVIMREHHCRKGITALLNCTNFQKKFTERNARYLCSFFSAFLRMWRYTFPEYQLIRYDTI